MKFCQWAPKPRICFVDISESVLGECLHAQQSDGPIGFFDGEGLLFLGAMTARALKPGGRFVAEFGGKGNIRAIHLALLQALRDLGQAKGPDWNPWYYPSIGEYASLLERHGLAVRHAALFDRPTPLEEGERGLRLWLEMFAGGLLDTLPPEAREQVIQSVERQLRPSRFCDGSWIADYARIRVLARRESEPRA